MADAPREIDATDFGRTRPPSEPQLVGDIIRSLVEDGPLHHLAPLLPPEADLERATGRERARG